MDTEPEIPDSSSQWSDKEPTLAQMKRRGDEKLRKKYLHAQEPQLSGLHHKLTWWCSDVAHHPMFQQFIILMILTTGGIAGISTYDSMQKDPDGTGNIASKEGENNEKILELLDQTILYIFTAELAIKIVALGRRPLDFFKDLWNDFDFIIVFMCYPWLSLGFNPSFIRIIRLFRVLKLLNALPELQILVVCLAKSFSSMIYILLLLFLLFYLYGVMACFVFQENDPFHFGTLELSFLSLYRVSTFEDWTDIMYINIYGCDRYYYQNVHGDPRGKFTYDGEKGSGERVPQWMTCDPDKAYPFGWLAAVYFVSFTVFATFIVFNLFVGVILTNIESARNDTLEEIRALAYDYETYKGNKDKYRNARDVVGEVVKKIGMVTKISQDITYYQRFLAKKAKMRKLPPGAPEEMPTEDMSVGDLRRQRRAEAAAAVANLRE